MKATETVKMFAKPLASAGWALAVCFAMSACSGGGGGSDTTPPNPSPPTTPTTPTTSPPTTPTTPTPPVVEVVEPTLMRDRLAWTTAAAMIDSATVPYEAAVVLAFQEEGQQPNAARLADALKSMRTSVARYQGRSDNDSLAAGAVTVEQLREILPGVVGKEVASKVIERALRKLWGNIDYLSDTPPSEQWRQRIVPASRAVLEAIHVMASADQARAAWFDTALAAGAEARPPSVLAGYLQTCSTGIECEPLARAIASIKSDGDADRELDSLAADAKKKVEDAAKSSIVESDYLKHSKRLQNAAANIARWLEKPNIITAAQAEYIRTFGSGLGSIVQNAGVIRAAAREVADMRLESLRWGAFKAAVFAAEPGGKGATFERLFELGSSVWTSGAAIVANFSTIKKLLGGEKKEQRRAQQLAEIQQLTQASLQRAEAYRADDRFAELMSVTTTGFAAVLNETLTIRAKLDAIETALSRSNALTQANGREIVAALRALSLQQLNGTIRSGDVSPDIWLSNATTVSNFILTTTFDENVGGPTTVSADPWLAFRHDRAALANALAQWPGLALVGMPSFSDQRLPGAEAFLVIGRFLIPVLENQQFERHVRTNKAQVVDWLRRIDEKVIQPTILAQSRAAASAELPLAMGSRLKAQHARVDAEVAAATSTFLRTAGQGGTDISALDPHASPTQTVTPRLDPAIHRDGIPACPGQSGAVLPASSEYVRSFVPTGVVPVAALAQGRQIRVCWAITGSQQGQYESLTFKLNNDRGGRHMLLGDIVLVVRVYSGEDLISERQWRETVCYHGGTDTKDNRIGYAQAYPASTVLEAAWANTWRAASWCADMPTAPIRDRWLGTAAKTVDWGSAAMATQRAKLEADVAKVLADVAKAKNGYLFTMAAGGGGLAESLERLDALVKATNAYVFMSAPLARNPGISIALAGDDGLRIDDKISITTALKAAQDSGRKPPAFGQRSVGVIDGMVSVWQENASRLKSGTQIDHDPELYTISLRLQSLRDWVNGL